MLSQTAPHSNASGPQPLSPSNRAPSPPPPPPPPPLSLSLSLPPTHATLHRHSAAPHAASSLPHREQLLAHEVCSCSYISEYRSEFLVAQRRVNHTICPNQRIEQRWMVELFPEWLFKQVPLMMERNCSDELIALARGPNNIGNRYNGFIINGFKFHTKEREKFRKIQNSGVMVEADGKTYYGALTDIYELDYYGKFKVVLFRYDWVDINSPRGLKVDTNGFTLVNFSRLIHTGVLLKDDPFIFSSQARQVFFLQDSKDTEWAVIIKTKPRDLYDMGKGVEVEDDDTYTQCMPYNVVPDDELNNTTSLVRTDVVEENTNA